MVDVVVIIFLFLVFVFVFINDVFPQQSCTPEKQRLCVRALVA